MFKMLKYPSFSVNIGREGEILLCRTGVNCNVNTDNSIASCKHLRHIHTFSWSQAKHGHHPPPSHLTRIL